MRKRKLANRLEAKLDVASCSTVPHQVMRKPSQMPAVRRNLCLVPALWQLGNTASRKMPLAQRAVRFLHERVKMDGGARREQLLPIRLDNVQIIV